MKDVTGECENKINEEKGIRIEGLSKSFGAYTVLKNINLFCPEGEITGIVGNNGSGKSVLFKCICGFCIPDEGKITVDGRIKKVDDILKDAGILIEAPAFLGQYSGYYNLSFLYEIRNKKDKAHLYSVMNKVGLDPKSRKKVSNYSLGMKQRLAIAQVVMEDHKVIILDEPMNGLDKGGVAEMRELFREMKKQDCTILLSSHNKQDIDFLCDTVYEMESGELQLVLK